MKTTKLFIVIDEEKLEVSKDVNNGKPLKFETEEQANDWASRNCEVWKVFKVHFKHEHIQHTLDNKLVPIEKKKFIYNEYVVYRDYNSAYDLVMELLDSSYCEQGDIKEMIEICKFCFTSYINIENDVNEAHDDWVENNYAYD